MPDAVKYCGNAVVVRFWDISPETVKTELGPKGRSVDPVGIAEFVEVDGDSCMAVGLELRERLRELEGLPGAGEVDKELCQVVVPADAVGERLLWAELDSVVDLELGTELLYEYSDAMDNDEDFLDASSLPGDELAGVVSPLGGVLSGVVGDVSSVEDPSEPDVDAVARDPVEEAPVADHPRDDVANCVDVEMLPPGTSEVVLGNASGAMANCSPFAGPILVTSA